MVAAPSRVDYKAPGGKLLRLAAAWSGERLVAITIAGDFFCHPEAAVEALESRLAGATMEEIPERFGAWQAAHAARLYGWTLEDFLEALLRTR